MRQSSFLRGAGMQYVLIMILFSSIVSADAEILDGETPSMPVEETEYVTLRGNSVPVPIPDSIVIYPIADFVRIEEDE